MCQLDANGCAQGENERMPLTGDIPYALTPCALGDPHDVVPRYTACCYHAFVSSAVGVQRWLADRDAVSGDGRLGFAAEGVTVVGHAAPD
jgi:hypothetical protein